MTKTYDWILFDADDTLFDFDIYAGLVRMFSKDYSIDFTPEDYQTFQTLNKSLWVAYQNGDINAQELQNQRFDQWAKHLNTSAQTLNTAFLDSMAEICTPLEGAIELLQTLQGKTKLGIITNGFTQMQEVRLERTGLKDHFEVLVISEEVGYAKPHPLIFDHAFELMGNPARDRVLMVGDNPDSDIRGGINAGVDTCWINSGDKVLPSDLHPHYVVSSLRELHDILIHQS